MVCSPLFRRPDPATLQAHQSVIDALYKVAPIPRNHRRDLPYAVRDLSRMLTQERGHLDRPYWAAPRFLSAYLYYFLPWNLVRLSWLLPQLPLNLPDDATIIDLGSGPLTLPLALWCSLPELRDKKLTFLCSDSASAPLEAGQKIVQHILGKQSAWHIKTMRSPLQMALKRPKNPVDLVMAGNVLNEISAPRHTTLENTVHGLASLMQQALAPNGQLLLIEPGTRLGGKMVALARDGAIQAGMRPLRPCPHPFACPMNPEPGNLRPQFTGWCHFTYPASGAPLDLHALGQEAKLDRTSVAISFVLLEQGTAAPMQNDSFTTVSTQEDMLDDLEALFAEIMEGDAPKAAFSAQQKKESFLAREPYPPLEGKNSFPVQIISSPIDLPDQREAARYGCCRHGLALAKNAAQIFPGTTIMATPVARPVTNLMGTALQPTSPSRLTAKPDAKHGATHGAKHGATHGAKHGAKPESKGKHSKNAALPSALPAFQPEYDAKSGALVVMPGKKIDI